MNCVLTGTCRCVSLPTLHSCVLLAHLYGSFQRRAECNSNWIQKTWCHTHSLYAELFCILHSDSCRSFYQLFCFSISWSSHGWLVLILLCVTSVFYCVFIDILTQAYMFLSPVFYTTSTVVLVYYSVLSSTTTARSGVLRIEIKGPSCSWNHRSYLVLF